MSASNDRGGVIFTDTGPTAPTLPEVRDKVAPWFRDAWGQNIDLVNQTPQRQILDSWAATVFDKNNNMLFLAAQFNPETAEGRYQDALAKIYFHKRKEAIPSSALCRCIGLPGTVIPKGAKAADKYGREYVAAEDVTIPVDGPAYVPFNCTTPGPIYIEKGAISKIVSREPGWDTVYNESEGTIGTYDESRLAFENRRYATVAKNAHGSLDAVWGAVMDLAGVVSVSCVENDTSTARTINGVTLDANSIFVSVVGDTDENVAWAIYRKKGSGCAMGGNMEITLQVPVNGGPRTYPKLIRFNRPLNVPCYIRVRIRERETPYDIDQKIRKAIQTVWTGETAIPRVEIGDTILGSKFYCAVNGIEDNFELLSIQVSRNKTTWADEVSFTLDEYPVAGDETISVERG